jgi:biotin synthase
MPTAGRLSFAESLRRGIAGETPAVPWLMPLLDCSADDAPLLYAAADRVREANVGAGVHLRALIEFSNHCRRNCRYCGLRRENRAVRRYRMTPEEIVRTARDAAARGYRTVVMQSGEDLWFTGERLAAIIREIKASTDLAITLSVGERDREDYRLWREAGADRFLLRIETTNPRLFAALHPDDNLAERQAALLALKELGYQLGSGVMVGLPGQTAEMLARDVIWLHELGAEMIGIGPFLPHPGTPLGHERGGTIEQTLRLTAVLRLVFPQAHLPATTAAGTLDPQGRERMLQAGANVMMPNVTPQKYRVDYEIYPNKICVGDDTAACYGCVKLRLDEIGRTVATDHGHVARVVKGKSR